MLPAAVFLGLVGSCSGQMLKGPPQLQAPKLAAALLHHLS